MFEMGSESVLRRPQLVRITPVNSCCRLATPRLLRTTSIRRRLSRGCVGAGARADTEAAAFDSKAQDRTCHVVI